MTGHYTGKIEAGKVFVCNTCGKTPNVGDLRYYEKKDDKWLGCTDFECFKKQGGDPNPASKSGGGKFTPNKHPISKATEIYNLAEGLLESFKKARTITTDGISTPPDLSASDQLIAIESFFRTLSGNFKP